MNKRDYVMRAIHHEATDKVPYCIRLTKEALDAYGDRLLQDYHNPEVMADYEKGPITKEQAVELSIGNYMIHVPTAWWN